MKCTEQRGKVVFLAAREENMAAKTSRNNSPHSDCGAEIIGRPPAGSMNKNPETMLRMRPTYTRRSISLYGQVLSYPRTYSYTDNVEEKYRWVRDA